MIIAFQGSGNMARSFLRLDLLEENVSAVSSKRCETEMHAEREIEVMPSRG